MIRRVALLLAVSVVASIVPVGAAVARSEPSPHAVDTAFQRVGDARMGSAPQRPYGRLPIDPQGLFAAKQRAAEAAAGGLGRATAVTSAPITGIGFDGQSDPRVTPPDPTGAIGPDRYIATVNLRYGIYGRDGSVISQGDLSTLAGIPDSTNGPCLSDPQMMWDPDTSRFFYNALDVCANRMAFGFSKTATPAVGGSADWCRYVGFTYSGSLPDYPKLGDSKDLILIGANIFALGLLYSGSDVMWIDKAPIAAVPGGCLDPANFRTGVFQDVRAADGSQASTPVPANAVDATDDALVVSVPDVSSAPASKLTVLHIRKDATTGTVSIARRDTVAIPSFKMPADAPEKNSRKKLDTNDGRLTMAVAAYDPSIAATAVWTTHTVFGGAGAQQRWYEVNADAGTLARSGTVTSSSLYVFNGAVSPDRSVASGVGRYGDAMVLGYNTSSSTTFPAIRMVSQVGDAPSSSPVLVIQSAGKNQDFSCQSAPCRWGDYSGASPDPAAPDGALHGTVWLTNQYNVKSLTNQDADWRTRIWSAAP